MRAGNFEAVCRMLERSHGVDAASELSTLVECEPSSQLAAAISMADFTVALVSLEGTV
ncbi:MAG TPA: hypothetical protein VI299_20215 [Polyangiales bacterium]